MKKRRAFTLSELLVVVVIIGVLSAVVLPKFSKVIETRKTTEAEELMSAVRTEQEARCTLSKKYTADEKSLGSYKDGKYFNYDLGTVGMTARATSGKYKLEMPSYADGRICCSEVTEGSKECEKLNKNYPLCSDLTNTDKTPDYVAGNENCEVEIEDGKETPTEPEVSCPAAHDNVAPYTDTEGCTVTTSWELKDYPTCWVSTETKSNCPVSPSCDNSHQNGDTEEGDCECGKSVYTWSCSSATNYEWKRTLTTSCKGKPKDETQDCPQGTGTQTRSYTCQNGVWTVGNWTGECCEVPAETTQTQGSSACPTRKQVRTFDVETCSWGAWHCENANDCPDLRWYTKPASDCTVVYGPCTNTDCYYRNPNNPDCPQCIKSYSGNCGGTPSNVGNNGCKVLGTVASSVALGGACGTKDMGSGQTACRSAGTIVYSQTGQMGFGALKCTAYECK